MMTPHLALLRASLSRYINTGDVTNAFDIKSLADTATCPTGPDHYISNFIASTIRAFSQVPGNKSQTRRQ